MLKFWQTLSKLLGLNLWLTYCMKIVLQIFLYVHKVSLGMVDPFVVWVDTFYSNESKLFDFDPFFVSQVYTLVDIWRMINNRGVSLMLRSVTNFQCHCLVVIIEYVITGTAALFWRKNFDFVELVWQPTVIYIYNTVIYNPKFISKLF